MIGLVKHGWILAKEAAHSALLSVWLACRTWPGRNLVFVSLLLIGLHIYSLVIFSKTGDELTFLRVNSENSVSEFWETALLSISALFYLVGGAQSRRFVLIIPAMILLYMAFDGSNEWHERAGLRIYSENRHIGEFIFMVAVSAFFGGGLLYSLRHADRTERNEILSLMMLLSVMAFFAIFVDALHSFLREYVDSRFDDPGALIEDGGELLSISVICALATSWRRRATADWVRDQIASREIVTPPDKAATPFVLNSPNEPAQMLPPHQTDLAGDGL